MSKCGGNYGHEYLFSDWYGPDDRDVRALSKLREVRAYPGIGPEFFSIEHFHVGSERHSDSYAPTFTLTLTGRWYARADRRSAASGHRDVSSEFLESDDFGR